MNQFKACIYKEKTWSQALLPVPQCKGSRIALSVERATPKAPRRCICKRSRQHAVGRLVYKHITRGVSVALFLTNSLNLRDSYIAKNQAYSYAFPINASCVPTVPQGAVGVRHTDSCKYSVFLLNTAIRRTGKIVYALKKRRMRFNNKGRTGNTGLHLLVSFCLKTAFAIYKNFRQNILCFEAETVSLHH